MAYRNFSLPKDMVAELVQLGKDLELGYSSDTDAVKDAIRRYLEVLRVAAVNRSVRAQLDAERKATVAGGA